MPLADWAEARLRDLAALLPSPALAALDGDRLLGMRARFNGFLVPGRVSAGGGCRLHRTRDGWIALNLARADDLSLLPALTGMDGLDRAEPERLTAAFAALSSDDLLAQGRLLGLAIAGLDEQPASPAVVETVPGLARPGRPDRAPLVVDLTALWAGPLAARLLGLGGARVIKVDSANRPDPLRHGDPALHDWLDRGKEHLALDLRRPADRDRLIALIRGANVVIEAARPRALHQLGIDAEALVREVPGLAWITITGHGTSGAAADWVGFGDDAAVAGGLSAALREATGKIGFVGDAVADPLSGLVAAGEAASRLVDGTGGRVIVAMSGVVAAALADRRRSDPAGLNASLRRWAQAVGTPLAAA
ncbi:CoA transferase [Novosphingobium piscinae]|uniref:CoA transferase n=1 Tax=Novosphingobium piscinae TaxID=1507448 RepID=A0A7X1KNU2_9SPHN|nr:CoA transferase [Novosphingobium piscinae]